MFLYMHVEIFSFVIRKLIFYLVFLEARDCHAKQESLREFYRGHFCLGNPSGRVVFINKFVGRHENLFYCKYSLEMKTRCNE